MNLEFGNTKYLFLLLILPIILFLSFSFLKWKKRTKNTFAEKRFHDLIFSREENFPKFVPFLLILAVSFLVLAMTDLISTEKEKIQVRVVTPERLAQGLRAQKPDRLAS